MEAKVQIMPVDKPTANNRLYPRHVVEKALASLKGKSLAVTHVNAFLDNNGCPKVSDSLGVARNLALDEAGEHVIAQVKIDKVPPDLESGYVIRSAGVGKLEGNVVTEFDFTGVIIARE